MAYYFIFPEKDTTIYSHPNRNTLNTGNDEILELVKEKGTTNSLYYPSRILLQFSNTDIQTAINKSNNFTSSLQLFSTEHKNLSSEQSVEVFPISQSWNEGTVSFKAYFTGNSTNTGTVAFKLAGVGLADGELTNIAFGTAVQAEAKAHSGVAYNLNITRESGAITIAGTPVAEEYVFFEISRDVSEDNFSADALLLGIKLFFTTNAGNDA